MSYQTGILRLKSLPPAFSLRDMCRQFGMTLRVAGVYASRWKRAELITPVGGNTGWFYNTLIYPDSEQEQRTSVLIKLYPSATLIGHGVLHAHGWSTQPSHRLQVAVSTPPSRGRRYGDDVKYPAITGVEIVYRPNSWYSETASLRLGTDGEPLNLFGLPAISPAGALVDLYNFRDLWLPDADDLYIDDDEIPSIVLACREFDIDPVELLDAFRLEHPVETEMGLV